MEVRDNAESDSHTHVFFAARALPSPPPQSQRSHILMLCEFVMYHSGTCQYYVSDVWADPVDEQQVEVLEAELVWYLLAQLPTRWWSTSSAYTFKSPGAGRLHSTVCGPTLLSPASSDQAPFANTRVVMVLQSLGVRRVMLQRTTIPPGHPSCPSFSS